MAHDTFPLAWEMSNRQGDKYFSDSVVLLFSSGLVLRFECTKDVREMSNVTLQMFCLQFEFDQVRRIPAIKRSHFIDRIDIAVRIVIVFGLGLIKMCENAGLTETKMFNKWTRTHRRNTLAGGSDI